MKRKMPEEKESAQSLIGHLSRFARHANWFHNFQSIRLYVARPDPGACASGLVAEFLDLGDFDCTKRHACEFLDTHTYVAWIVIEYGLGIPLSSTTPSEEARALRMDDGYQLSMNSDMCHIRSVPASSMFGSTVNIEGLHDLVRRGEMSKLQEVVPRHFHVSTRWEGATMLHIAAIRRQTEITKWLVQQPGIEIDATDLSGSTAFLWAANEMSVGDMVLLHRHGASLLAVDRNGNSALHEVVRNARKHNMDEFRACLVFLCDRVPLSLPRAGRSLSPTYEAREAVKQELSLVGRRIRDTVSGYLYEWCPVRALASIIVQYWESELSLLDIP